MQDDLPFQVNTVDLTCFEKKGHPKQLLRGTLQKCKRIDKKKKGHVMKIVPKGDENDKAIEAELQAHAVISHPNVAALKYYFEDEQNHYLVYARLGGKNLPKRIHKVGTLDPEWVQIIGLQFLSVLEALHKEELYYLRQGIDNMWVDSNMVLTIVGLDYCGLEAGSPYLDIDKSPSIGTDWLSLGYFIHYCLTDKPPERPFDEELEDDAKTVLSNCLHEDQAIRNDFHPRMSQFLMPPMEVEADDTHFKVNDFEVNWEEGFVVTLGGFSIGWKNGLYFKFGPVFEPPEVPSEDNCHWPATRRWFGWPDNFWGEPPDESIEVTLGLEGLSINDGSTGTEMTLGLNGLEARNDDDNLRVDLNDEGVKMMSNDGGIKVTQNGAFRLDMGNNYLTIEPGNFDIGFDAKDFKKSLKGGGVNVEVGDSFKLYVGSKGLKTNLGPAGVKIDEKATTLSIGPMAIKVCYSGMLIIKLGGFQMKFDKNGCTISAATMTCKINSAGMDIEIDGFHITCGGGQGVKIETEYEFNWGEYLANVGEINVNLQMPKLPGGPKIPEIDLGIPLQKIPSIDLTRPDKEGPPRTINDYLEGTETVKGCADCIKTRMFSHKQRKVILTSAGRLFYCTPSFSYKMGDIELGLKSTLTLKDDDRIIVTNMKGRKYDLQFVEGEEVRDQWAKWLKPFVAKAVDAAKAATGK